jgi:hypothetical protein
MTDGTDDDSEDTTDDAASMYNRDETTETDTDGDDETDDVASMYNTDGKVGPGDVPSPDSETDTAGQNDTDGDSAELEGTAPKVEAGGKDLEDITGTFYVKYVTEKSVTLHEVNTAQICTLIENPGFERHEIVEAVLQEQPPMGVSYLVEHLENQYTIPVEYNDESPTKQVTEFGVEELDVGEAVQIEREGKGKIHVLKVEPEQTETSVEGLLDDGATYKNAARYDNVERVEIRSDEQAGVVSVRYLP